MTQQEMLAAFEKYFIDFTHPLVTKPPRFAVFNPYGRVDIWMFQIWVSLVDYPRPMLVSMDCSDEAIQLNSRVLTDFVFEVLKKELQDSCDYPPKDEYEVIDV